MKFYLSSYGLGNQVEELKKLIPNKKIGYIPNARDRSGADPETKKEKAERDIGLLRDIDIEIEMLDLSDYFGKKEELKKKIEELGAIFICGGNSFVLLQAMKLSGLDEILKEIKDTDFLYSGYSAAGCVLFSTMKAYPIVDDSTDMPYEGIKETVWEGLGLIDFAFMPHWNSDHPESADIDKEIEFCKQNNIPYKAIRDGEVIIIE